MAGLQFLGKEVFLGCIGMSPERFCVGEEGGKSFLVDGPKTETAWLPGQKASHYCLVGNGVGGGCSTLERSENIYISVCASPIHQRTLHS